MCRSLCCSLSLFFLKILFIYSWETHSQRCRQREKQAPHGELDVGLDPRTPGSRPEPKADAQLLSTQASPSVVLLKSNFVLPFLELETWWSIFLIVVNSDILTEIQQDPKSQQHWNVPERVRWNEQYISLPLYHVTGKPMTLSLAKFWKMTEWDNKIS